MWYPGSGVVDSGTSFVDQLCYLCFVFAMRSRLFIAALWSPAGKGLLIVKACVSLDNETETHICHA